MVLRPFTRWSLKLKVTLFTLGVFLAILWTLAFFASRLLQTDMQRILGEQQASTVAIIAEEVNQELVDRLDALQRTSKAIKPELFASPSELQAALEGYINLQGYFNGGTYVVRSDGQVIADNPIASGRLGLNYAGRDYIVSVMKGKETISKPFFGKSLAAPLFVVLVPIRDGRDSVVGALAGVINLGKPSFLDKYSLNRYGKTGGYLLVDARNRLIVTATDKRRVMETLPPVGVNPTVDRFIKGFEGTELFVNPLGERVIASSKWIPQASWYAVVNLSEAEAFEPIRTMQKRMFAMTLIMTMLAACLTWWILMRQLAPMLNAVKNLAAYSFAERHPQAIPVESKDEIGDLINAFNRLLQVLSQRETALRTSEERLSALFSAMTEVVVLYELVFDAEGKAVDCRVLDCNAAFTALTGVSRADAIGKLATEVFHTPEMPHLAEYARVAAGGSVFEHSSQVEALGKHLNTSVVSPQRNQIATISSDVTLIHQAQDLLASKNKELENYLYVASHDLRAPLLNIQGFSRLFAEDVERIKVLLERHGNDRQAKDELDGLLAKEIPEATQYIVMGVSKMETLIRGLLEVSRTGRIAMRVAKVDMAKLIHTIFETLGFQLSEVEVLVCELPDCHGDENQLNQLFSNLIGNALKYRDPSRPLRIEVGGTIEGSRVRYHVKDNGIGIDPRHYARIWDVFYRVDPTGRISGDGLGLNIVRRIAERHRGRVWVESQLGQGSEFFVELEKDAYVYNAELGI